MKAVWKIELKANRQLRHGCVEVGRLHLNINALIAAHLRQTSERLQLLTENLNYFFYENTK